MERALQVLVTDDDERILQATFDILQHAGYEVRVARDGNELLCAYRERTPDLVVCDLFMPGKDGLEIIGELLKISPQARIVAMSGGGCNGVLNLLQMARHLGAREILAKPFGSAQLLEVVRRALE